MAERGNKRGSEWKADHHAYGNSRSGENGDSCACPHRAHHGAGKLIFGGLIAELFHLFASGLWFQQGMVDYSSE